MTALRAIAQYDGTQDTGIEWLGDIPAHWQLKRLKFIVDIVKRIAGKEGFDVLSITQKGIKVKDVESGEGQLAMDYSKYQFLNKGEFAMNHMDLLTGYVDRSQYDGVVSPDYRVFRNRSAEVLDAYLLIIFQMGYTQRIFYKYGQGVSFLGRWRFPADNFNSFFIPIPSLDEQKFIVDFVSRKSEQIDEAIAIKEKQITLLKERKQVIIQKAVTQGLNPDTPMKDSGVDWIGEIPEHWEVKKVKHFSRIRSGDSITNSELFDEGRYEVYGGNGFMGFSSKFNVEGDTIIIGRVGALCGNVRYINERKWISDNALILKLGKTLDYHYAALLLDIADLNKLNTSSAQPLITGSKVMNFSVPIPPLEEREKIMELISVQSANLNRATDILFSQIEKLKEYKTTLINSAVTGKIKVA